MKCFLFTIGEGKQNSLFRKYASGLSSSTTLTEFDMKKSGSELCSRNVYNLSDESVGRTPFPCLPQKQNYLRRFTFEELKAATRDFSRSLMLGEGGFGCVYRGTINCHEDPHATIEIAVKQLSRKGLQGHKEWLTEVNVLGVVQHPNLVRLVGYCAVDDERGIQRLLVYEYMPNRSVEFHLSLRLSTPLSWSMRLKIALDAARGLNYLHEGMDFQIIFRDFKTSNILLDEHWTAKLSDFGLARQGPTEGLSHVSTVIIFSFLLHLKLMIMYDQDPDVVRWGLHLLQGEFSSSPYGEVTIQSDTNIYQTDCSHESNSAIDCTNIENDEVIANAYQEELSQIALAEASGTSYTDEEHLQASVLAQDWLGPENDTALETVNVVEVSSLCKRMDKFIPVETITEGHSWSLELADDSSSYDGEVGKILDKMVPVPHVPRINGDIPSVDEATSDHERLLERLKLYDLIELKIEGDGNCQFRSLSDQFYRTPEHHKFIRQQVVHQLKSHPDIYEGYVPMAYEEYLKKISKNGEWGDHVTLQAAADSYGVKIFVLTSFKDTCYIEIIPVDQKSKRVICLSFWAEVHYNSIYPEGEVPTAETKKKKSWWHFGHRY